MAFIAQRTFPYSVDGVTVKTAAAGAIVTDIPERLIPGLRREGFLVEAKAIGLAPENKALMGAAEIKTVLPPHAGSGSFTLKSVGFGKFRIIDAAGQVVSGALPKADAQAELDRMNG